MAEIGLSRKQFLHALGAAGLGGAVLGPGALLRPAAARADVTPRIKPTDLSFSTVARYRPFEVVASGFEAIADGFDGASAYRTLAPAPEQDPGTMTVSGGTRALSGRSYFALLTGATGPQAPYAAVEVDVASFAGVKKAAQDTVYAGLAADADNYVVAAYNHATQTVTVEAAKDGQRFQLISAATSLPAPLTFAFALNQNNVIALANTGKGFVPLVRANVASVVDLRVPSVLARYHYGFGARADSGTIVLDGVRAGYWGKAGVRDPHVVTWADGTPLIVDNKVYLTLTNAGLGFFEFAHWGVYTLDLSAPASPSSLRQVGKIFWERGGLLVGDHAGHIVYDDAIGAFRLLVSNWGTFSGNGVLINSATVSGDVLHGVSVIRNPSVQPLPTDVSRWDPHMVKIDGRWYVAFVESPSQNPFIFHPALARGPRTGEFGPFTLVGRDAARTMTEGMVMQKIGGTWYVLCSSSRDEGPPDGGKYRIYDLGMRFLGFLDAPYPTNIPHPMVFPVADTATQTTRYRMVTFDGTPYHDEVLGYGTHGDFYVMSGTPVVRGYEFPPREPPVV
jgi:hypothetical protein